MRDLPDEPALTLPCPTCDYDLRGQTDPRCPECGRTFASIDELRAFALDARRVFNRVLRWRIKFAVVYAISLIWGLGVMGAVVLAVQGPSVFGTTGLLIGMAPLVVMPALAFVFLIQVLRLRFDSHIGQRQRRELNGTIPILLIYMLPALVFIPMVAMLVFNRTSMGAGI